MRWPTSCAARMRELKQLERDLTHLGAQGKDLDPRGVRPLQNLRRDLPGRPPRLTARTALGDRNPPRQQPVMALVATSRKTAGTADTRQPVVQGRSFSGFRTAQMCLMRSPAMSNANTVTVMPSC